MISAVLAFIEKAVELVHVLSFYIVNTYGVLIALAVLVWFALLWRLDRTWGRQR